MFYLSSSVVMHLFLLVLLPCPYLLSCSCKKTDRLQLSCQAMFLSEEASSRRQFVFGCGAIFSCAFFNLNCGLVELPAWAGEVSNVLDNKDDGVLKTMKSLFDPDEKTKSGKVLPKAYLKSAREVVKTLHESLKEDLKDIAKFRRTADVVKESIREYLNGWRGQKTVVNEMQESYLELEKAIRSLASFYSKTGPSATLPEEIKSDIINDLNKAEEFL